MSWTDASPVLARRARSRTWPGVVGLGLVWGVCTQRLLALQGMKALAIPWGTIVAVVVGSAVVGVVAALLPALRASRMNVLSAIAHD